MNWEMLAAVGQLAAVCIGIPSIIYLAVQIRAQTKERRRYRDCASSSRDFVPESLQCVLTEYGKRESEPV